MIHEFTITLKAEFPDDAEEIISEKIYERESMVEEWWDELVEQYEGEQIYENI